METDVITIRELVAYVTKATKTLYRLAAKGILPGFKAGEFWHLWKSEIDKWIRTQEATSR